MLHYFINEKTLIQLELNQKKGENVYEIITFFRHTHKVHIMSFVNLEYKEVKKIYDDMCKRCLE